MRFLLRSTISLLGLGIVLLATTVAPNKPPLPVSEIVNNMVEMNAARTSSLRAYTAIRRYHVVYDGLAHDTADMTVRMDYAAPGPKVLTLESQSGSTMLRHHVLDPLLKMERKEALIESREGSAIVPANYEFALIADVPQPDSDGNYVIEVKPRRADRFLFRGRIWVNAQDFAITRVEGEPTHSPSWWVTDSAFQYRSQHIGDFWLPASNECSSHTRFFGHAQLSITYDHYQFTSVLPVSPPVAMNGSRP